MTYLAAKAEARSRWGRTGNAWMTHTSPQYHVSNDFDAEPLGSGDTWEEAFLWASAGDHDVQFVEQGLGVRA